MLTSKICIFNSINSKNIEIHVKWLVLQLCGQRDHLKTKFNLFSYPNRSGNLIPLELITDRNAMLHFQMKSSLVKKGRPGTSQL